MRPTPNVIAGAACAALLGMGLVALGQYAGGLLFADLQDLPHDAVGVFTLRDYWKAYGTLSSVRLSLALGTATSVLVPMLPVAAAIVGMISSKKRELHGSARFANLGEVRASGLLDEALGRPTRKPGIIVGKHRGQFLVFNGDEFVLLVAPTRTGKGVAIIIPNLLAFPDSVVVLDIKGENFDLTSKFRQSCGQAVFRWAPFDEAGFTHRWNPLERIARSQPHKRVSALQRIAARLFHAHDPRHKFFYDAAADLFQGLALYLIDKGGVCTFGEILRKGSSPSRKLREHLAVLANEPGLSGDCVDAFARVLSAPDETLGSIASTFNTGLRLFSNPIVDAATSACDFDIREVRRRRMSIYLVLPARELAIADVLANLFFAQLIDENMDAAPGEDPSLKYQCLLVLDEFTSMGRIDAINSGNAFIAGYGLRMLTVVQSVSQMEPTELYGVQGTRTLVVNHAMKVVFPPKEQKAAKELSESLGTLTVKSRSRSRSTGKGSSRSVTVSDQRRALMMEQELREMPPDDQILLGTAKPVRCSKAYFYSDPVFMDRLKSVSPSLASVGRRIPTREELDAARQAGELRVNDIARVDAAAWHESTRARTHTAPTGRALSASEQLELDAAHAGPELLSALKSAFARDLAELNPGARPDVSELLAGLTLAISSVLGMQAHEEPLVANG